MKTWHEADIGLKTGESFKVLEWTSCIGRYICVHVRMPVRVRVRVLVRVRVCEHVKILELLCTKLEEVATCSTQA